MLTFSDLVKRAAELAGSAYYTNGGQGTAEVPIDAHDLDKCKRVVNDGFRMFIADSPVKGWKWMKRLASVTFDATGEGDDNIDGDPARYYLPAYFNGQIDGPIHYDGQTGHATPLEWVDESFIRQRRTPTIITGYPRYAAILPHEPATGVLSATRRWELMVNPNPVKNDTVVFPYTLQFEDMQLETGTATSGSATELTDASRIEPNGYFVGWVLRIIDGAGRGQSAVVSSFASGVFTFEDLAVPLDGTSVYAVEPAGNLHPAGRAFDSAVLDAVKAEVEKQFENVLGNYLQYYRQVALPQAHLLDARSAPRQLGPSRLVPERVRLNVTYVPRS